MSDTSPFPEEPDDFPEENSGDFTPPPGGQPLGQTTGGEDVTDQTGDGAGTQAKKEALTPPPGATPNDKTKELSKPTAILAKKPSKFARLFWAFLKYSSILLFCAIGSLFLVSRALEKNAQSMHVIFTPNDKLLVEILEIIRTARESIVVVASQINSQDILLALTEARKNGKTVIIVFDPNITKEQRNAYSFLVGQQNESGKPVFTKAELMLATEAVNHQFMIIDGRQVLAGTFLFSSRGQKQFSELIPIKDPRLVESYFEQAKQIILASQQARKNNEGRK